MFLAGGFSAVAAMNVAATAVKPVPVVEGSLPLDSLVEAAKLEVTTSVLPVQGGGVDTGSVTSEGVAARNVPAAQTSAGTTGATSTSGSSPTRSIRLEGCRRRAGHQ